jgi:hypothetical protein
MMFEETDQCVLTIVIPFPPFFHSDEVLPLFQIDLRTLSRQMEGSERV